MFVCVSFLETTIFTEKFKGEDVLLLRIALIPEFKRLYTVNYTRFCNDYQQSTRTIVASMWITFEESMLLT